MSVGRDKLNDFSLLKSLIGGSAINKKTARIKQAHKQNVESKKSIKKPTRKTGANKTRNTFKIPQYGNILDKSIIAELENPKTNDLEELIVEIDINKERQKSENDLFYWLCKRFSKCFNPMDKKPLKIGIGEEIEIIYQNENYTPVDKMILRNVLRRYVGDTRYQKAVFDLKKRYDLSGNPVEDFSEEHIQHAKNRLDEIAEKAELRAKGINIREYYENKRAEEAKQKEETD